MATRCCAKMGAVEDVLDPYCRRGLLSELFTEFAAR